LMVHCQDCARKTSATLEGFKVLNQFTLDELREIYQKFCHNSVQNQQQSLPPSLQHTNMNSMNSHLGDFNSKDQQKPVS